MAYELRFENERRGLVVRFTGGTISDEPIVAVKDMYARDGLEKLLYSIWDFSRVRRLAVSEAKLREIATLDQNAAQDIPPQKVALIGTDQIFQGSDERYAVYAEVWAGFETLDDARGWLPESPRRDTVVDRDRPPSCRAGEDKERVD